MEDKLTLHDIEAIWREDINALMFRYERLVSKLDEEEYSKNN